MPLSDKAEPINYSGKSNISKALFTETTPKEPISFTNPSLPSTEDVAHGLLMIATPKKPTNSRTTSPTKRDYKTLYEDVKNRLVEYSAKTEGKLNKMKQDYDLLQIKYDAEIENFKSEYKEREEIITSENNTLKNKLIDHSSWISQRLVIY